MMKMFWRQLKYRSWVLREFDLGDKDVGVMTGDIVFEVTGIDDITQEHIEEEDNIYKC